MSHSSLPKIWAIADLHLSFALKGKEMDIFGPEWKGWTEKIANAWRVKIADDDLVLIAGDISWAMHMEDVTPDLEWIHALPGVKVMIKGNHDYWWESKKKVEAALPSSLHIIQNNVFNYRGVSVGGARLWDSKEYHFRDAIVMKENPKEKVPYDEGDTLEKNEKIFVRELSRLDNSLKLLDRSASVKIAMTHYPPLGADLLPSRASAILEKHGAQHCVFGHLHSVIPNSLPFGEARGVQYHLTSCDYLDFVPLPLMR